MLREITRIRQTNTSSTRRWFTDDDMDLYLWFDRDQPVRFHLAYNKQATERSLSWEQDKGYSHTQFDPSSVLMLFYGIPPEEIEQEEINAAQLAHRFLHSSDHIEATLADFIYARLLEYPGRHRIGSGQGLLSGSF